MDWLSMHDVSLGHFSATNCLRRSVEGNDLGFNCIISCSVLVSPDYISNIVACADMFNAYVDYVFRRDTSTFSSFGFSCICLAMYKLLTFMRIIGRVRPLRMRSSCSMVS